MTITTLRPHRAKADEVVANAFADQFPEKDHYLLARAIVNAVLVHLMYSALPYAEDGMPTSETAEIMRFNRRLREIIDEAI